MIELGPVNFHIAADNDREREIAHGHLRTARVLLGGLAASAGGVAFQSRTVTMPDGTEIVVTRNTDPYTGQAVCSARIRPQAGGGALEERAAAAGPFLWIGLRDRRAPNARSGATPFMTIWEPGAPGAATTIGEAEPGGQILSPSPRVMEGGSVNGLDFLAGATLVRADSAPSYYGTCDTPAADPAPPSAIGFDPWRDLPGVQVEGAPGGVRVITRSGLIGIAGVGFDPTLWPGDEGWSNWVQSFEADPGPGMYGEVDSDPPGSALRSRADGALGWPQRYDGGDGELSVEELELVQATILDGPYLVKLGIFGSNYKPGQFFDVEVDVPGSSLPHPSTYLAVPAGPIPVTLKIVTGRGDAFRVQEFEINLSVPTSLPWGGGARPSMHRTMPGHFDSSYQPSASGGSFHGAPFLAWAQGVGPVELDEGACMDMPWARDTGSPPAAASSDSQYELATFEVDPWAGATRRTDLQPWGL